MLELSHELRYRQEVGWKRYQSKFNNRRTEVDNIWFASALEAECYMMLKSMLLNGELTQIETQKTIKLTKANIAYRADFVVTKANGEVLAIEAKGDENAGRWPIIKRLYKHYGPFPLEVYKRGRKGEIYLDRVIIPVDITM